MSYIGMVASNAMIRQISQNKKKMNQNGAHLSGGEKIKSAMESASGYQISERMRVMIRGLGQCGRNTESGTALLATAEGGMQQTTELLKKMRELSVKAANGIYTDADMRAMNDEYQQCMQQIDDIASGTTYNGMHLLDGSLAMRKVGGAGGGATPPITTEVKSPPQPTGVAAASLTGTTWTITGDGVFTIPAGFTGDILVKSTNVLIKQATAATLTNVSIQCDVGTNLFIEDLNIKTVNNTNLAGKSAIDFKGAGNTLNLKGTNTIEGEYGYAAPHAGDPIKAASLIHAGIGAELTIQEDPAGGSLRMEKSYPALPQSYDQSGAVVGGDFNEDGGTITINSGNIYAKNGKFSNAAAIGGGFGGNGGTITIHGGTVEAHAEDGAAIGGGGNANGGTITIDGGTVKAVIDGGFTNWGSAIGGGAEGPGGGNVTLAGGKVEAITNIGTQSPMVVSPPIGNGGKGSGFGAPPPPLPTINESNGTYTVTGDATRKVGTYVSTALPPAAPGTRWEGGFPIQTGTRSNQVVHCYINDIRSEAIGVDGTHLLTQEAANRLLGIPPDKGLLDTALNVVLSETTRIGAYQMRLAQAKETITAAEENTTAAESVIRDADMAQEMTDYMKNSILSQSAQAMLAQANQAQAGVLDLLK